MSEDIDKKLMVLIGSRFRETRLSLDLDQTGFGKIGKLERGRISDIEKGSALPSTKFLLSLQNVGGDVGYILTGQKSDGSLGQEDTKMVQLFGRLTMEQREAIVRLLMTMTDAPLHLTDLPSGATRLAGFSTLQEQNQGYKAK